MKKLLITAFDAFGQDCLNASFELLKQLPDQIGPFAITKLQIPTVRYESFKKIQVVVERERFDYIIALGQAANTKEIRLEKVAINLDDFRIPDNAGHQPIDEKILLDGENAYFSQLPLKAILSHVKQLQMPVTISYSAGTFLCNHVMYQLLHHYSHSGFIHVPQIKSEQQVGLDLAEMVEIMTEIIRCLEKEELKVVGGNLQ